MSDIKTLEHKPSEHNCHIVTETLINSECSGLCNPQIVKKRWGHELIYINSPEYCMKRISIDPGCRTSMHFHVAKHETLLVAEGILKLTYRNRQGDEHTVLVPKDHAYVICPGFQHQLEAYGDEQLVIIEASTTDRTDDSVRVRM